jgi:hypothetical protein
MEPSDVGTRVLIHTNLQLSGAVAQYGRGVGMIADLAQQIIAQFADSLEKNVIAQEQAASAEGHGAGSGAGQAAPAPITPAAPVQMGGMGFKILWNAILRGIKGLFGRS